jgi:translation initiation factor 1
MAKKTDNPFAALDALRAQLPVGPAATTPAPSPTRVAAKKPPARAVVRLERKQRRGKEVTVVDKLGIAPGEPETWCKDLKQALGCGGTVEGEAIVLQGDLRQRVAALLTDRGIAKVTLG